MFCNATCMWRCVENGVPPPHSSSFNDKSFTRGFRVPAGGDGKPPRVRKWVRCIHIRIVTTTDTPVELHQQINERETKPMPTGHKLNRTFGHIEVCITKFVSALSMGAIQNEYCSREVDSMCVCVRETVNCVEYIEMCTHCWKTNWDARALAMSRGIEQLDFPMWLENTGLRLRIFSKQHAYTHTPVCLAISHRAVIGGVASILLFAQCRGENFGCGSRIDTMEKASFIINGGIGEENCERAWLRLCTVGCVCAIATDRPLLSISFHAHTATDSHKRRVRARIDESGTSYRCPSRCHTYFRNRLQMLPLSGRLLNESDSYASYTVGFSHTHTNIRPWIRSQLRTHLFSTRTTRKKTMHKQQLERYVCLCVRILIVFQLGNFLP